jgi:hypothetical protein
MATKDIHITAHNPKGLDYDYLTGDLAQAETWIKTIFRQGGQDITVNGFIIPPSTMETILAK